MDPIGLALALGVLAFLVFFLSKIKLLTNLAMIFMAVVITYILMALVPAFQIEPVYSVLRSFFEMLPDLLQKFMDYVAQLFSKFWPASSFCLIVAVVINQSQVKDESLFKDKLFTIMLAAAGASGLWLSLASAGYLLAFNINTLLICCVIFMLLASPYIMGQKRDLVKQLEYAALAILPIMLRTLFNLPFFNSYKFEASFSMDLISQLMFAFQVIALWTIVAVAEECFRAGSMNVVGWLYKHQMQKPAPLWIKILVANVLWIIFHFIQRPLDLSTYQYYILWLFVSGLLLGWLIEKQGLGSACLAHFVINLTA